MCQSVSSTVSTASSQSPPSANPTQPDARRELEHDGLEFRQAQERVSAHRLAAHGVEA